MSKKESQTLLPMTRQRFIIRESQYSIAELPERLRPENEIERLGVSNVSDAVLLATILRGNRRINKIDLARGLLTHFGSLNALRKSSVTELASVDGMTTKQAQALMAGLELAARLLEESVPERCSVRTPKDVVQLLGQEASRLDVERFWIIMLDSKNHVIGQPLVVSSGILDASLVHPREVFREAIRSGCSAIVLAHNHPSNDAAPSAEDIRITRQLVEAGRVVDIKVIDHLILGSSDKALSMREEGVVTF